MSGEIRLLPFQARASQQIANRYVLLAQDPRALRIIGAGPDHGPAAPDHVRARPDGTPQQHPAAAAQARQPAGASPVALAITPR